MNIHIAAHFEELELYYTIASDREGRVRVLRLMSSIRDFNGGISHFSFLIEIYFEFLSHKSAPHTWRLTGVFSSLRLLPMAI